MNKAAALVGIDAEQSLQEKELLQRSSSNFESGIRTFDLINDRLVKSVLDFLIGTLSIDDETDDNASQPRQTVTLFSAGNTKFKQCSFPDRRRLFLCKELCLVTELLWHSDTVSSSYFFSIFLFSPIFKQNLLFSYFLVGEAKICKKIKNGIIVVLCFRVRFIIKKVVC